MIDKRLFEELTDRIAQALRDSPAADVNKNLRALFAGWFDRFDLVLREDFDVQKKLLASNPSVNISPGVRYGLTPDLDLYGFIQQPVYQRVNGVQLTADWSALAGISQRF